ncbi:MAG: helix-turn-helix domain-containing protein [Eubacteriales bacterium]|nr:helix-turn-helix domain-containing protein [Eubacteriales bacterium]
MDKFQELEKSLQQLKQITGLDLSIRLENDEQIPEVISQVKQLSSAFKEKYNKDYLVRKWIKGQISSEEAIDIAKKIHVPIQEKRVLYLIQTQSEHKEDILTILKNMYPYEANIWILQVEEDKILLLQTCYRKMPNMDNMAKEIVDTIGSEAMISVKVSYSRIIGSLYDLPKAYKEVSFAMEVGTIFRCEENVYGYNNMGIGRLLYTIPDEMCRGYLEESLNMVSDYLESDAFSTNILKMVDCFLDNNLNIAETARQLHVHRNTLLYRLDQIEKELGLDIRKFNHAMTYKMASLVVKKMSRDAIS